MATRANYIFINEDKTICTCYIHYDGYLEGAAEYFQKALLQGKGKINSPRDFIKANEKCELCTEIHGDIEYLYKYYIDKEELKVYEVEYTNRGTIFNYVFSKNIYDFVNEYFPNMDNTYKNLLEEHSYMSEKAAKELVLLQNKWYKIHIPEDYKPEKVALCYSLLVDLLKDSIKVITNEAACWDVTNPNYKNALTKHTNLLNKLSEIKPLISQDQKETI